MVGARRAPVPATRRPSSANCTRCWTRPPCDGLWCWRAIPRAASTSSNTRGSSRARSPAWRSWTPARHARSIELPGWRASYEAEKRVRGRKLLMERMAVWSGWERLLGRCRDTPSRELQDLAGQYNALMCRPVYVGGDESEFMHFETSARQAERVTSLGDVPLLIMTRDTRRPANAADAEAIAEDSVWDHEQEEFKKLTPRSWRVVARGAGHAVQHDRLDLVVRHMTILVAAVRGGRPPPYGSPGVE